MVREEIWYLSSYLKGGKIRSVGILLSDVVGRPGRPVIAKIAKVQYLSDPRSF